MTRPGAAPEAAQISSAWAPAPAAIPPLSAGEVHVFRAPLAPSPAALAALAETLSPDERDRAARFVFERHRHAFIAARGALRALASGYAAARPAALRFGYAAAGKPFLAEPATPLELNVSHSGSVALLAFARGRALGVDVEERRALRDLLALAEHSFTPRELGELRQLPADHHVEAFFACWSRKEAFIKATGAGIAQLRAFDVTLVPGVAAQLLRVDPDAAAGRHWTLHDLPPIAGYAAALAVDGARELATGEPLVVRCWDWQPDAALAPGGAAPAAAQPES